VFRVFVIVSFKLELLYLDLGLVIVEAPRIDFG